MWIKLLLMFGVPAVHSTWVLRSAVTNVHIAPLNVQIVSDLVLSATQPADIFMFSVHDDGVAHIEALSGGRSLPVKKLLDQKEIWEIALLKNTSSTDVSVTCYYTSLVRPLAKTIGKNEDQTWEFRGNVNVFSPYVTQKQETIIHAAGKKSKEGPFYNAAPFTPRYKVLNFEDATPLAYVTNAVREISISNWGKIHVTDNVALENRAASLKGGFSRLKLPKNTLMDWTSRIPPESENIYYGDAVGTIYTLLTQLLNEIMEVKLTPRFPLLGGWKTEYQLAYSFPSSEYLETDGTRFCLNIPLLDTLSAPVIVEDFTLKIVLPEGSQFTNNSAPEGFTKLPNEWKHVMLDTTGRQVLVFNKLNVVEGSLKNLNFCYTNDLNYVVRYATTGLRAAFYIFTLFSCFVTINRLKNSA